MPDIYAKHIIDNLFCDNSGVHITERESDGFALLALRKAGGMIIHFAVTERKHTSDCDNECTQSSRTRNTAAIFRHDPPPTLLADKILELSSIYKELSCIGADFTGQIILEYLEKITGTSSNHRGMVSAEKGSIEFSIIEMKREYRMSLSLQITAMSGRMPSEPIYGIICKYNNPRCSERLIRAEISKVCDPPDGSSSDLESFSC